MNENGGLRTGDNGIPDPSSWIDPFQHPYLRRKSRSTVYRWLQEGRLRSIRLGVEYITTQEWIDEFIQQSSAASNAYRKRSRPTQTQRRAQVEEARRSIEARRNRRAQRGQRDLESGPNTQEGKDHD